MQSGKKGRGGLVFNLLILAAILIGVGLLAYPTVADWYNRYHSTRLIAGYSDAVAGMSDADFAAMRAEAEAYNQELPKKPGRFSPDDAELERYNAILDVTGTGIMGYIEIPAIKVRLPVYHTVSETVLQIAAGHLPGSSFPIGGAGAHAVISGHSALPSAKLFTDLELLDIGDMVELHVLDEALYYKVDAINVVLPEEMDLLALDPSRDYITLITCTPYGVNSHRLLVRCIRTDAPAKSPDLDLNDTESMSKNEGCGIFEFVPPELALAIGVVLVGFIVLMLVFGRKRPKSDNKSG